MNQPQTAAKTFINFSRLINAMLMTQVSSSFIRATDTVRENTLAIPVYISLQHPTVWLSYSCGRIHAETFQRFDAKPTACFPGLRSFFFLLSPQTKWSRELASTNCGAEREENRTKQVFSRRSTTRCRRHFAAQSLGPR